MFMIPSITKRRTLPASRSRSRQPDDGDGVRTAGGSDSSRTGRACGLGHESTRVRNAHDHIQTRSDAGTHGHDMENRDPDEAAQPLVWL